MPEFCHVCGAKVLHERKFCGQCGTKIISLENKLNTARPINKT